MSALLDALKAVSQEDLDACEAEIARLEADLIALRAARGLMRSSLGQTVDKVAAMIAGKKRKAVERRADAGEMPAKPVNDLAHTHPPIEPTSLLAQRRIAIHKYLTANGATPAKVLCQKLDIPDGSITATITHGWFKKTNRGVELV